MNVTYGYIEDGKITAPVSMRSNFNGVGGWHTLTDEERAAYGWYPADVINEGYDQRLQERTGPVVSFDGGRITVEYTLIDKTLDQVRSEALSALAEIRYTEEIRDVVCEDSGVTQSPKRSERMNVADKIAFLERSPGIESTPWKDSAGNWHTVTLEDLQSLLTKMREHVDNAYRAEHDVATNILVCQDIEEVVSIDLQAAFSEAMTSA